MKIGSQRHEKPTTMKTNSQLSILIGLFIVANTAIGQVEYHDAETQVSLLFPYEPNANNDYGMNKVLSENGETNFLYFTTAPFQKKLKKAIDWNAKYTPGSQIEYLNEFSIGSLDILDYKFNANGKCTINRSFYSGGKHITLTVGGSMCPPKEDYLPFFNSLKIQGVAYQLDEESSYNDYKLKGAAKEFDYLSISDWETKKADYFQIDVPVGSQVSINEPTFKVHKRMFGNELKAVIGKRETFSVSSSIDETSEFQSREERLESALNVYKDYLVTDVFMLGSNYVIQAEKESDLQCQTIMHVGTKTRTFQVFTVTSKCMPEDILDRYQNSLVVLNNIKIQSPSYVRRIQAEKAGEALLTFFENANTIVNTLNRYWIVMNKLEEGLANGIANAITLDGLFEILNGEFKDGELISGSLIDHIEGVKYIGSFKDGLLEGTGKVEFNDGFVYEGNLVAGLFEGIGKLIDFDGTYYKGPFQDGLPHGKGMYFNGTREVPIEYQNGAIVIPQKESNEYNVLKDLFNIGLAVVGTSLVFDAVKGEPLGTNMGKIVRSVVGSSSSSDASAVVPKNAVNSDDALAQAQKECREIGDEYLTMTETSDNGVVVGCFTCRICKQLASFVCAHKKVKNMDNISQEAKDHLYTQIGDIQDLVRKEAIKFEVEVKCSADLMAY